MLFFIILLANAVDNVVVFYSFLVLLGLTLLANKHIVNP